MSYNVMVIGDTHLPFEHRDYLKFCKRIHNAYKPRYVVHIGDLVDNHAISYHEKDPDGLSPADEMAKVDSKLKLWFNAFPKVKLCMGNHDNLVGRKCKTYGLPSRVLKPMDELWNFPKGWEYADEYEIGDVLYMHGIGCSGKTPHLTRAQANRQSTVIGHCHSVAGTQSDATRKDCIFGMCVGCGINRKLREFAYGKPFPKKPIIGCGIVEYTPNGINPTFLQMHMRGKR